MYTLLCLFICVSIAAARCIQANDGSVVCDDGDTMLPGVIALAILVPFFICIFLCVPWNFIYYPIKQEIPKPVV